MANEFWSLKHYTSSTGEAMVSPCLYEQTERGALALYQIWHPCCPASSPEAAVERAKELSESTGDPFRLDHGPLVPYPS